MPTIDSFSPIDTSQIRNQSVHNPMSTATSFENVLGNVGLGLNLAGPVADSTMRYFGQNKGAAYTSAAIMGFNGGGAGYSTPGFTGSWGPAPGMTKNLSGGMPPPPPGFSGGGMPAAGGMPPPPGMGGVPGGVPGGGGMDVGAFDSQINAMMNNNLVFLSLQTKVQNTSQTTQMMSNIHKTDSDAKLNAIRNMRA